MATFFSGASIGYWSSASNTMYGTLTGDVSRSGNTVTLSNMRLAITSLYTSWGTSNDSFTVNGTNTGFTVNFGSGSTNAGSYALNNTSFSVGVSDTSANVGWTYYGGGQQTGQGSFTVTFPSGASAPTGLSVSIAEVYPTGARFNVSLSSYGNPSSASGRYIEAAILNQNTYGATYKFATASNTTSSAITVNNSSAGGTLVVQPNKQYYYGAYASNTQLSTSKVQGQFVTKAEAPTVTFTSATTNSATFSYSASADGGHYDRTLQYSIDNGATWVTIDTLTGGSSASGAFTVSSLLSGAAYTMKVRTSTTAGAAVGTDVSFDTIAVPGTKNLFYGPVSDEANPMLDLYGEVGDRAKRITKLYGSVNGEAKVVHQGFGHHRYMMSASYQITTITPPYTPKTPDLVASIDTDKFVERCNSYAPVADNIQKGRIFNIIFLQKNPDGEYIAFYFMSPAGGEDICRKVSYADAVAALAPWGITLKSDPGVTSYAYVDRIQFEATYS